MSLLIKHPVKDIAFKEQLRNGLEKKTQLSNVLSEGTTNISNGVALKN